MKSAMALIITLWNRSVRHSCIQQNINWVMIMMTGHCGYQVCSQNIWTII